MDLSDLTKDELREEAKKKYKTTGLYTRAALYAQHLLYQDKMEWGERKPTENQIENDYEGYEEE